MRDGCLKNCWNEFLAAMSHKESFDSYLCLNVPRSIISSLRINRIKGLNICSSCILENIDAGLYRSP